jgi:6-pyruvoyltetrahydropterin/6-carboxytetrahydropterin synthase
VGCFELIVRSEFRAAHRIPAPDGSLEPLHEHNWRVEAFFEGDALDKTGLVADFTLLRRRIAEATRHLSGVCLNNLPAFAVIGPSAEMIARHVYELLAPRVPPGVMLTKVRVWETEDCAAAYLPPTRSP